jgi:hypothetical protein
MSTQGESPAPSLATCAWRTGAYACRLPAGSGHRCAWHAYWLRLVDAGNLGRQQYDEFGEWWEQFQPWGQYAENHGPWWAAIEALWPALTGLADPPVLTRELRNELLLRRADVRRYLTGQPSGQAPWPRLHGQPLPAWSAECWQARATNAQAQRDRAKAEVA